MRKGTAAGLVGLFALPVLGQTPVALAEESRTLKVDSAAWSWRQNLPAGSPVQEPSNVPDGGLAVAFDGRPDAPPAKATYLRLALGDLPATTQVLGLTLRVPVDTDVQQDPTTAVVVACRLKAGFAPGTGTDPATMPAEDCSDAARGSYDATSSSFTFLLTGFVADWVASGVNHGVVLRPDPAAAFPAVLPFDLALKGAASITGALSAVVPSALPPAPQPGVGGPAPAPLPEAPAPQVDVVVPPIAPVPPVPSPQVVAPASPQPQLVAGPVLREARTQAPFRASTAGLAAAGALGVLLLALVGWSLGETTDPRWFARMERRRLDRLQRGAIVLPVRAPRRVAASRLSAQPTQSRQGRRPRSTATSTVTYS